MKQKISVIIPVYNVEKYLRECLESVLEQSYKALEILLIDDGSKDNSGKICDEYAQKDHRIRVIHQENKGAASAKNVGLCMATGTILTFVDSDDVVEPGAYEKMIEVMEKTGADVVQGSFYNLYTDGIEIMGKDSFEESGEQFLVRFTREWTCGLLWDKMYSRELFDGVFFQEGNIIDDEFFTYRGIMNARKIVRISDIVYGYRQRKSGVMASVSSKERIVLDKLHYLQERRIAISWRFPDLAAVYDEHYLNMLLILSHDAYASEQSLIETKSAITQYFRKNPAYQPPFLFRIKLMFVKFASRKRLLNARDEIKNVDQWNRYFE